MNSRRRSDAPLPHAPLDFSYPLTIRPPGPEGAAILREVAEERAFDVLRALRLVLAWTRGPETAGPVLRPEPLDRWEVELHAARFDEGLWNPLVALVAELRRPWMAEAKAIASACFALSDWALGVEAEGTALLFAEAAALAWPTNSRYAWLAGRLLRNCGQMNEGEMWLRRAARVAVWSGDSETQDLALNSLGNLYAQRGLLREALEYLSRALALAQRLRLKQREGAVSHDLFRVFVLTGNHNRAEEIASCAFELYGPDHPNLPRLAHDVVHLWLRQGRFPLALPVLRALAPHLSLPHERLRVVASTARAAGACGDRVAFESAWETAWQLLSLRTPDIRTAVAAVLIDLGYGAASLSDWERAQQAFHRALEAATEAGATDDAASAETALETVRRFQRVETPHRRLRGTAAMLADAFVRSLEDAAPESIVVAGGTT